MGDFQCPKCLAIYANLGLLASHMERDDNISSEWIVEWVSIFADPKMKPRTPSPSPFNSSTDTDTDTTEVDLAVARFRVWFVLDGLTIHRREIPGNERFEGFCSQMESLFYNPGSNFDVSQFEYVLIGKKRGGGTKTEPFTGASSYQRMRNELLEVKSPWRHATVRRIVTGLSALESYVKMGPMVNSYQPPVPDLRLAPSQLSFRWISQDQHSSSTPFQNAMMTPQQPTYWKQPIQAAEAPSVQPPLPFRTTVHMPVGSSIFPAQITATPLPPSPFKSTSFKSSPLKWIRPKGPVRYLSQSPTAMKTSSSGLATRNRNADGQILLLPTRGSSHPLFPSPLAQPPESMGRKRRRVTPSDTALGHETLPSSPLARHKESVTKRTVENLSTLAPPINSTDQSAAWRTTTWQMQQPTQRKRKFIHLRISNDDGDEPRV